MNPSDHLIFGVRVFLSISLVAMVFSLLGVAPDELARPMFAGGIVIALSLMIVHSVVKIWHRGRS